MKELINWKYAIHISMPLYALSCRIDNFIKGVKGKEIKITRLPQKAWDELTSGRSVKMYELTKADGNVRKGELAIISSFAAGVEDGTNIFEIGTFDGRTTLNLAFNSPPRCKVFTLDLPPEIDPKYSLAEGERMWVEKHKPGSRIKKYSDKDSQTVSKITQLLGDSASFDFSPYENKCSLVFVDGSHSYENVKADTHSAMSMLKPVELFCGMITVFGRM